MRVIAGALLVLTALATAAGASPPGSSAVLARLADNLRRARASGEVAPAFAKCPSDSSSLRGVSRSEILAQLGTPNWCAGDGLVVADCDDSPTMTYFVTGKPKDMLIWGGGFPELTFRFGPDDAVLNVECHYSR